MFVNVVRVVSGVVGIVSLSYWIWSKGYMAGLRDGEKWGASEEKLRQIHERMAAEKARSEATA